MIDVQLLQKIRNMVEVANPERRAENLDRRLMKLLEECGECAQAYLSVTSENNARGKTWGDLREELVDVLIVALDIALTPLPTLAAPAHGMWCTPTVMDGAAAVEDDLDEAVDLEMMLSDIACGLPQVGRALRSANFGYASHWMQDMANVAAKAAFMVFPSDRPQSINAVTADVLRQLERKLDKWHRSRLDGTSVTGRV